MATTNVETLAPTAAGWQRAAGHFRHPLYTNAFFLWANTAVGALGGFIFWVLAAHWYTASQVGLASAALSAIGFVGLLMSLGLGNGLIRYLPGAGDQRSGLINVASTIAIAAAVGGAIVFLLGLPLWAPNLSYLRANPLYVGAFVLFVAASAARALPWMSFVALRGARYILIIAIVGQLVRVALPVPLVPAGAFGIVLAGGLAILVALALDYLLLRRVEGSYRPRFAYNRRAAVRLVPFGLANHGADLALTTPSLLLPILAVEVLGAAEGAHFYIGFFMGAFILAVVQSLATSLFAEGSHDEHQLFTAARRALLCSLAVSAAGIAAMLLVGSRLLLIFGSGYSTEATRLLWLTAASSVPAAFIYVGLAILRVRKHMGGLLVVAWAGALTTLALAYAAMRTWGLTGAGVGMLGGQCLGALLCIAYLAKERVHVA